MATVQLKLRNLVFKKASYVLICQSSDWKCELIYFDVIGSGLESTGGRKDKFGKKQKTKDCLNLLCQVSFTELPISHFSPQLCVQKIQANCLF